MEMQTKKRTLLIVVAVLLVVMAALGIGAVWMNGNYVLVNGEFYPAQVQTLDLRGADISEEAYIKISRELPECDIVWDVPFQEGKISSTETELTVTTLTDTDVHALKYLPYLETVHGEDCKDYDQLMALQERYSQCQVCYRVELGGKSYSQNTASLTLNSLTAEEVELMGYLPLLNRVRVSGCEDYALLQQVQQQHPEWDLTYTVEVAGEKLSWDTRDAEVCGATYEELERGLPGLPELTSLTLRNPDADAQQLQSLREAYPEVDICWQVEIGDMVFQEDTVELDISGVLVESCEEVERLVACLPNLEKLIMSDCGIDNETMADFRERQRANYKVVWTVYLSDKTKARTDDLYFMPIQQGEYYLLDEDTPNLKYCEDMICIDVGHHMIHNIDFVAYMPHLKYLILAHTGVRDVSPIVNCKELVYLEVDWSEIQDYSPLVELTALEDLNINKTYCDITPLLQMTWLKNLWAPGRSTSERQQLIEALPNTHVEVNSKSPAGQGWRNLPNYYAMRDVLGMYYMD